MGQGGAGLFTVAGPPAEISLYFSSQSSSSRTTKEQVSQTNPLPSEEGGILPSQSGLQHFKIRSEPQVTFHLLFIQSFFKSKFCYNYDEVISKPSFWLKFMNLSRIEAKILKHSLYSVDQGEGSREELPGNRLRIFAKIQAKFRNFRRIWGLEMTSLGKQRDKQKGDH